MLASFTARASSAAWMSRATCAISCAITPASSDSHSAARIRPGIHVEESAGQREGIHFVRVHDLDRERNLRVGITHEFWPMRFTYSVITGSRISFDVASTSWAYCLPMRICLPASTSRPARDPPLCDSHGVYVVLATACLTLLFVGLPSCDDGWLFLRRRVFPISLSRGLLSGPRELLRWDPKESLRWDRPERESKSRLENWAWPQDSPGP